MSYDAELEMFRLNVTVQTVLVAAGWQSEYAGVVNTAMPRKSEKFFEHKGTAGSRIIIASQFGRGWYDPKGGEKGDVVKLVQHLRQCNLGQARQVLRSFAGTTAEAEVEWRKKAVDQANAERTAFLAEADSRWNASRSIRPGSQGWRYLVEERGIPVPVLLRVVAAGVLREGYYGTAWGLHRNAKGERIGWEMRGPTYRGFVKHGGKGIFSFGSLPGSVKRIAVTEAMIDAMSLAAIEGASSSTLYVSTGGGFGPDSAEALRAALQAGATLVAATDNDAAGNTLADRLAVVAQEAGASYERLVPQLGDWNDQLRQGPAIAAAQVAKTAAVSRP